MTFLLLNAQKHILHGTGDLPLNHIEATNNNKISMYLENAWVSRGQGRLLVQKNYHIKKKIITILKL